MHIKSPRCFLPSSKSVGLSVQEKKLKINIKDSDRAAILDFQSVQFPIGSYFWCTSHPDASYQVSSQLAFCFRRRSKNRFSRWQPWRPSWISDRTVLAILDLQVTPMLTTKFHVSWLSDQEKKWKIDFQVSRHGGHLGFPIGTILAIFDLQVTPMLPTKFQVVGLSVQEKKGTIDFQDGRSPLLRPSCISDRKDFSYFDLQVTLMLPTKFQINWPFGTGEETKNRFSRWRPSWICRRNNFN